MRHIVRHDTVVNLDEGRLACGGAGSNLSSIVLQPRNPKKHLFRRKTIENLSFGG